MKTLISILLTLAILSSGFVAGAEENFDILDFLPALISTKHKQEQDLIVKMASIGYDAAQLNDFLLKLTTQAIFYASELNNGTPTFTGTLTQVGNTDEFVYSLNPTDRLLIVFTNGNIFRIITNATLFTGYADGTWEDFLDSHNVKFNIFLKDVFDLRITSVTTPIPPEDPVLYNSSKKWTRNGTGTLTNQGIKSAVNVNNVGKSQSAVDPNYSFSTGSEQISGTAADSVGSIAISEGYWWTFGHDASINQEALTAGRQNNNKISLVGTTLQLAGSKVTWEYVSSLDPGPNYLLPVVSQPELWGAQGTVLKNGQGYGAIKFDGPVLVGTSGPWVILRFNNGETLKLFKPINRP